MGDIMQTSLNPNQKLQALAYRFYSDQKWKPEAGHYYTTSRADLELYRVVDIKDGKVYTEYCTLPGVLSEWPEEEFTEHGFGPKRVWVPQFIFDHY